MIDLKLREEFTATASEDFKNNRMIGARYIDKTPLLAVLLDREHETTFFLRPRRFGKTLTLSMIRYFVEDTRDSALNEENRAVFQGLKILEMGEKYTSQMTSYPVINLTLQTVGGLSFREANQDLKALMEDLYGDKAYLLESDRLQEKEKNYFQRIMNGVDGTGRKASIADYKRSLRNLTEFLRKDSGKRTVVLIDEYDVPLEKAYRNGYYRQMVNMIGPMLQNVLKTNSENLQFAVITGCLRIAKEGIYTGLNNPEINTVYSKRLGDAIGFTEPEVRKLLADSGFPDHFDEVKEWYDGYRFGNTVIYNPWSVIKHIEDLTVDPESCPMLYWKGTSGNAIIRELADRADQETRNKAEQLVQGGEITFKLKDDIVYDDLFREPDNVFNVMLAAGYLTAVACDGKEVRARIPNLEVRTIYTEKFSEWFRESISTFNIRELYAAMEAGEVGKIQKILNGCFLSTMSYYDTVEAFYHGVMLALLQLNQEYQCESNRESGSGRFDIQCKRRIDWDLAYVLEFKISKSMGELQQDAEKAAKQIEEKGYVTNLQTEYYKKIMTYGISFCGKHCMVAQGKTYEGS
jgi:hypothetical protein